MRVAFVIALLIAVAVAQSTFAPIVNSSNANGFDVIVLDSPSWVTHIQSTYSPNDSFYVFGESTLRTIAAGNVTTGFYAMPITENWLYPLIDLHTFFFTDVATGTLIQYTFGPSDYSPDDQIVFNGATGPYIPLFIATNNLSASAPTSQRVQPSVTPGGVSLEGFLNSALRVDLTQAASNKILTYWAGFVIDNNETLSVAFTLTRTYYTPDPSGLINPQNNRFIYNSNADCYPIYQNQFTSFSNTYKPSVHFIPYWGPNNHTIVIVVDPNSRAVYMLDVNLPPSNPSFLVGTYSWGNNYKDTELVSDTFHNGMLVVGLASTGFAPGYIFAFDFTATFSSGKIPTPYQYTLPQNYSNPKALTTDGTFCYIGLNGFSEILQMQLSNGTIVGYQRLPIYLHRSWAATQTSEHVYFVTYEQNSKVFRVNKKDFCPATCPYDGYCKGGVCACSAGFVMSSNKQLCQLEAAREVVRVEHHYHVAHSGEIALGVFFTLSTIAAAAGWFMWWRGRGGRGAYQAV